MIIRIFPPLRRITRRRRRKAVPDEALRAEAKAWLIPRLATLAEKYGFTYNKVFIKNNISNWGSCSTKGNINLNMQLMRLPEELRDYVILHELCHLRQLNHGAEFHALLDSLLGGREKELRRELRKYHIGINGASAS
ncbi:MAG: M48 family metallopeptidase [Bacteroidales bacterium]|nr:M48 family metallopeptidase [Bacteroidales bacterium]